MKPPNLQERDNLPTKDTFNVPKLEKLVRFDLREEDNLPIKDETIGPNVSFIRRFHCRLFVKGGLSLRGNLNRAL